MRILAIDYGGRFVGLALSDPTGSIASPLETLDRRKLSTDSLIDSIAQIVQTYGVEEIVVGLPLEMSGDEAEPAQKTRKFAQLLKERLNLPVHLFDERLSTAYAHRLLDEAGVHGRKRKSAIDALSAAVILQSFLDARRTQGGGTE